MTKRKGLQYVGPLTNQRFISTYNPDNASWNELLKLRDVKYILKGFEGVISENAIYSKTCIAQAFEYYEASINMSLNTKPLLLYYCILNLSKAFLMLENKKRPVNHHGLGSIKYKTNILEIKAKYSGGILGELSELLNFKMDEQFYTLKDFIMSNVDLCFDAVDSYDVPRTFVVPQISLYTQGDLDINFYNLSSSEKESIIEVFEKFDDFFVSESNEKNMCLSLKEKLEEENFEGKATKAREILKKYFDYSILGSEYSFFSIHNSQSLMPKIISYYGVLLILSSLVRYEPQKLDSFLNSTESSEYWFISRICELSTRSISNIFMNLMYDETIVFKNF